MNNLFKFFFVAAPAVDSMGKRSKHFPSKHCHRTAPREIVDVAMVHAHGPRGRYTYCKFMYFNEWILDGGCRTRLVDCSREPGNH